MCTYKFNRKIKPERKKYGIQKLKSKVDHKIYSTKGLKERCSKNNKKITKTWRRGNSIIVAEEILIVIIAAMKIVVQPIMAPLGGGPASGRVRVRVRCRSRFAAVGYTDVVKCGVEREGVIGTTDGVGRLKGTVVGEEVSYNCSYLVAIAAAAAIRVYACTGAINCGDCSHWRGLPGRLQPGLPVGCYQGIEGDYQQLRGECWL